MIDVLAAALAVASGNAEVLARLGGALGEAARAAHAERMETREARAARRAQAMMARAVVPVGLRGAHPSWIEAALVELPARARTAVAAGGGDLVDVWLARWATAGIPPMPAVTTARVTSADAATRVDASTLERWLAEVGADQLALALSAAGAGAIAAAARVVGERLTAAAARIKLAPRAGALGPMRAVITRCRVTLDERALVRIGARAIAPYIDGLARLQIMHRLPRPLGLVIGGDLAARVAVSEAPRWAALAAP